MSSSPTLTQRGRHVSGLVVDQPAVYFDSLRVGGGLFTRQSFFSPNASRTLRFPASLFAFHLSGFSLINCVVFRGSSLLRSSVLLRKSSLMKCLQLDLLQELHSGWNRSLESE